MASDPLFDSIPGSVTAPAGFRAWGESCRIKGGGGERPDLALVVADRPGPFAGTFTTNRVCAAPVRSCMERMGRPAGAIVANSGNANACTGEQGRRDAEEMARRAARSLDLEPAQVLPASTGRIGVPLPMERILPGIERAAATLTGREEGGRRAALAIMTSDTVPKEAALEVRAAGSRFRIGGIAKGAGMIAPSMHREGPLHATMLAFLTTDLAVEPSLLQEALDGAVSLGFNRISVDGDTSTNDTVLLLSTPGESPVRSPDSPLYQAFRQALERICEDLAGKIVSDGEGTSRVARVVVEGALDSHQARKAALAVANSQLVKASWAGGDPNWGRVMAALGASGARLEEGAVDLAYSNGSSPEPLPALRAGTPCGTPFEDLCDRVAAREFTLHIDLNQGEGSCTRIACDLTQEYVRFNQGDTSDPASMGG